MTTKKKSYALPIIMMIALFGMISFVTNLAAPMGQVLKEQFGVSNFQGLLGNAANFIAYAVMGIPGGMMLQRIGYKKNSTHSHRHWFPGCSHTVSVRSFTRKRSIQCIPAGSICSRFLHVSAQYCCQSHAQHTGRRR